MIPAFGSSRLFSISDSIDLLLIFMACIIRDIYNVPNRMKQLNHFTDNCFPEIRIKGVMQINISIIPAVVMPNKLEKKSPATIAHNPKME